MGFIKLIIGLTLIALPISLYVYDFISTENLPYGIEPIKSLLTIIIASKPIQRINNPISASTGGIDAIIIVNRDFIGSIP
jgi:hypothetical protein